MPSFTVKHGQTTVKVIAEKEGDGRYMVRAKTGKHGPIRLGTLTGQSGHWHAEHNYPPSHSNASSMREACSRMLSVSAIKALGLQAAQPAT